MKTTKSLIFVILLSGCSSLIGKNPENLKIASNSYFDLPVAITSITAINPYGKEVTNFANICSGRYLSKYEDDEGTYYAWPERCNEAQTGGIWVPFNYSGTGVQFWGAVKESKEMQRKSLVVAVFDPLEAGRIKKYGGKIISPELLNNINVVKQ